MDAMKGQGGIQMLLTAEQEAQQIVSAAKNLKTTRLRQAREEAEKEAALFRTKMESEYQKKLSETSGNSDSTVKQLEVETDMKIKNMKEATSKTSREVAKQMVKYILKV
ncbi:V-type proton ATPase subunit G [Heracleum sosnowskyi]|uniref:V-type proton ATPase subunit G n=1 Tax=Heracleum sosnowskyi TaxID=360622 RepID=A0AAD8HZL2_9APIA|nr:V-type proton ATPase subunit G [Heracleum sosnowskyi]